MQMTIPLYKLQIVTADGERVATFQGGGAIERHLVLEISREAAKRVGWWRRAAVRAAVADAVMAVIDGMKVDVTRGIGTA